MIRTTVLAPQRSPTKRLAQRLRAKGLSHGRFATAVGVDVKTVRRWLANANYKVRDDNAHRAAEVLGCTPHDLWPNQFLPRYGKRTGGDVAGWAVHRDPVCQPHPVTDHRLAAAFRRRHHRYRHPGPGGHVPVRHPRRFLDTLLDAAARGVAVRFLVGDPDGATMILRGEEEGIGEAVIARCRTSVELLAPTPAHRDCTSAPTKPRCTRRSFGLTTP